MASHNVGNAQKVGSATKVMTQSDWGKLGGRPAFWKSPEELDARIEEYYLYCQENNKPFLITGLAFYCGISRRALLDYSEKDAFLPTIQKMRQYAEFSMEEALLSGKAQVGAIFSLKNNFGWKDVKDVNVNETVTISSIVGQVMNTPIDSIEGNIIEDEEALLLDE